MNTISLDSATQQFNGSVKAGEFVAWWISDDSQSSMPMVRNSHATADAAIAEAQAEAEAQGVQGGFFDAELVVDGDE